MDYRREIPSLSSLSAFESAARHCSFTAAARELSTSQPAISRHIDNLEVWLNCPLFERRHNRIKLTVAGRRLYQSVIRGFEEIRSAVSEICDDRRVPKFTIGCTYDVAHCWLMPRFSGLRKVLEGVEIQVVTSEGHPDPRDIGTDLLICGGQIPNEKLHHALVLEEEVFPVCSADFARRHAAILEAGDIERFTELPLLHLSKENLGWANWQTWFAHFGCEVDTPGPELSYNNYVYLLEAAASGEGMALGWTSFVERYLEAGLLTIAHHEKVRTGFGFWAIWNDEKRDHRFIDPVVRFLRAGSDPDSSTVSPKRRNR